MIKIEPRDYQKAIFETAKEKNTLVVLPTGLGKTLIAFLLTVDRKEKFPLSKILFLAPTRPLVEQHISSFQKNLPELYADLQLFTGEVSAEKRKKIWQTAEIIFATPQCVDGQTQIFTIDGSTTIADFFKKFKFKSEHYLGKIAKTAEINERILGYSNGKICLLKAVKAWKLSANRVIQLKTEIGHSIMCTPEHPLLTITKKGEILWQESEKLEVGEYVASAKEISLDEKNAKLIDYYIKNSSLKVADKKLTNNLLSALKKRKKELQLKLKKYSRFKYNFIPLKDFVILAEKAEFYYTEIKVTDNQGESTPINLPMSLNKDIGYIIGSMLGDGHIGNRKGHGKEVVFSDLDREGVKNEFKATIKKIFGIEMREEKRKGLITYNSALANVLSSLGVQEGKKAKTIRIPKFIFFSSRDVIKGFLKGIFDTDGSASKYSISISSANKKFIEDLKMFLLRFGIVSNISQRNSKEEIGGRKLKEGIIYNLRFSGRENLEKFLEVNPNKEKCEKLIYALEKTKRPYTRAKEIIPVKELMIKISKENKKIIPRYKFLCLSVDNLKEISEKAKGEENDKLKEILSLPFRWVKIKEKKEIKKQKEVYDLTIENEHNFIANSIVSHNTISNDLQNSLYNLSEVSLLIIDEAHRCLKNYDYTKVVEFYKKQSLNPRILGLTASPGHDPEKIKQICKHLDIQDIELRTRNSPDVLPYLQELDFQRIDVPFPKEFIEIKVLLKRIWDSTVTLLREKEYLFGPANKITLLQLQNRLALQVSQRNFSAMHGMSLCAKAIKISHAMELLETQTLSGLSDYLHSLQKQATDKKSKAVQSLVKSPEFNAALISLNSLLNQKIEHPKIEELAVLSENEFKSSPSSKIIIFTQFRDTASIIKLRLSKIPGIVPEIFVGQAKKKGSGLSQKEQREIIEKFKSGEINTMISTSIGEEGLDIPEVNAVFFYEPIPSAIRKIQRAGRTARLSPGKLFILVTKDTRDEIHHYASSAREKKMHKAIHAIKDELHSKENQKEKEDNKDKSINDFL